ncbi:MAG TPA: hypothetical protein VJL08_05550 [Dehalococcoidia bacterium]|nr:hypothetical protein [Dehalococcoidia bacterium]
MGDVTVNEKKLKIKEGPFRSYDVSAREVLNGTKNLLRALGYAFLPNDFIGFVQPSFRARREWPGGSNEIVAIVRPSIKKAQDGFTYLTAARSVLGDRVEYALVLPPINEHLLLDFLRDDCGRMSKEIESRNFMLWMYNPAEDAIMSFVGSSLDRVFMGSFLLPGFISMRIIQQRAAMMAEPARLTVSPRAAIVGLPDTGSGRR